MECKKHPRYKAIREPRVDCLDCWKKYALRQPYPTAWAYEQACKALHEKEDRIRELEAELLGLRVDDILQPRDR